MIIVYNCPTVHDRILVVSTVPPTSERAVDATIDSRCAGVDGCRSGWVVATRQGAWVAETFSEVVASNFIAIGVDMPIGLPRDEARVCEPIARRFISPRGSTIFPTPPRDCLDASSYIDACSIARALTGKAISKQAWNI